MVCPTCNGTQRIKKAIRDICLIEVNTPCPDCSTDVDPVAQAMSVVQESSSGYTVYVGEGCDNYYPGEGDCS